jgi:hypothetical protein
LTIAQAHQISARTKSVLSALFPSTESGSERKLSHSASGEISGTTNTGKDSAAKIASTKDQITIVALTAPNPKAAGKLISVVEIAKREIEKRRKASGNASEGKAKGKGWWQYTQLKSVVREVPRETKQKGKVMGGEGEAGKDEAVEQDDEEDDAFEPVPSEEASAKRKRDGKESGELEDGYEMDVTMKKRAMPVLTVYLSTVPVRELKMAFG